MRGRGKRDYTNVLRRLQGAFCSGVLSHTEGVINARVTYNERNGKEIKDWIPDIPEMGLRGRDPIYPGPEQTPF